MFKALLPYSSSGQHVLNPKTPLRFEATGVHVLFSTSMHDSSPVHSGLDGIIVQLTDGQAILSPGWRGTTPFGKGTMPTTLCMHPFMPAFIITSHLSAIGHDSLNENSSALAGQNNRTSSSGPHNTPDCIFCLAIAEHLLSLRSSLFK
jgi:hypothetical protein